MALQNKSWPDEQPARWQDIHDPFPPQVVSLTLTIS